MFIVISETLITFIVSVLPKTIHTMTIKTKNICVVISESLVLFDVSVFLKTVNTMTF